MPLNCSPFLLSTSAAAPMNRAAILGLPPFRAHRQSHPKYLEADWKTNISVLKHPQPNPGALADSATNFTSSIFFARGSRRNLILGPPGGIFRGCAHTEMLKKGMSLRLHYFLARSHDFKASTFGHPVCLDVSSDRRANITFLSSPSRVFNSMCLHTQIYLSDEFAPR